MNILIVGASKGLGRAFVEGLGTDEDKIMGVSRSEPEMLQVQSNAQVTWICADMSQPVPGADLVASQAPAELDVIIYNLGIWEKAAFSDAYRFLDCPDEEISNLINTNVTSALILLKRLLPRLLNSKRPQVILIGSTSGLPQCDSPEVAFSASKFALRGMADALREGFREQKLAVTCLHLGDLNTNDLLAVPRDQACQRQRGYLIPVHDVVDMTRALLQLSDCAYVKELTLPAILDERF